MTSGPVIELGSDGARSLWKHLFESSRGTEEVAFLFAAFGPEHGGRFRVFEWYPVPPDGFAFCSALHFELSDETRAYVIKRAHDLDACLIEVHSHDDPFPPAFSPSDLYGFNEFVPHVWWRLKGRPYAAVVIAPGGLDGLAWRTAPDEPEPIRGVEVDGRLHAASQESALRWRISDGYSDG